MVCCGFKNPQRLPKKPQRFMHAMHGCLKRQALRMCLPEYGKMVCCGFKNPQGLPKNRSIARTAFVVGT
jgi:hypothetical protein